MRVFFALWPDPGTREAIAADAAAMLSGHPGEPVAAGNYHMTLCFIGEIGRGADGPPGALVAAGRWPGFEPFTLTLDRSGAFGRASVCWLGPSDPPPGLAALHAALHARIDAAGYRADPRAFHPHLTVARACRAPPPSFAGPPLRWAVDGYVLCASHPAPRGVRYEVLARYGHGTDEL